MDALPDDTELLKELEAAVSKSRRMSSGHGSAFSSFQKQAEKYPQLSSEEQLSLVKKYHRGLEASAALKENRVDSSKERLARKAVRDGEKSLEFLIMSNFRLVLIIVRENAEQQLGRNKALSVMPDLVSEANIALTEAAQSFDVDRSLSFSTYAARVIRDRVRMVLSRNAPIRVSPAWHRVKRIAAARKVALTTSLGRSPSTDELKEDLLVLCLAWAEDKLTDKDRLLSIPEQHEVKTAKLRKQGMLGAIEQLERVLLITDSPVSLDVPMDADGSGSTLGDMITGVPISGSFESVELKELRESLDEALQAVSKRDRSIVYHRFGFVDGEQWKYAKIADKFGVTSERVRQIEKNVLKKMASPAGTGGGLESFLPGRF